MNYGKKTKEVVNEIPKDFKCPYCFKKIMANGVAFRSRTIYTKSRSFSERLSIKAMSISRYRPASSTRCRTRR